MRKISADHFPMPRTGVEATFLADRLAPRRTSAGVARGRSGVVKSVSAGRGKAGKPASPRSSTSPVARPADRALISRSDGDALAQDWHGRRPAQFTVDPVTQGNCCGKLAVDDVGCHWFRCTR
jgi:hypothetical protein